jgi:hypothetical protein
MRGDSASQSLMDDKTLDFIQEKMQRLVSDQVVFEPMFHEYHELMTHHHDYHEEQEVREAGSELTKAVGRAS